MMTRRETMLAAIMATPAQAQTKPEDKKMYDDILKAAMEAKRGVTFYVQGQTIGGGVTKIGDGWVEVRNQTHSRVVIRLDRVDAIAMP